MRAFTDGLDTLCLVRDCMDLGEEMGVTANLTGRILGRWEDGEAELEKNEDICV